ncbi:discoidin domain-containing protein [Actinoplanes sp. KI2]|uniref:discoidin domain-containing protein n=1 Tax=Actinoplanes sp. KI2 TaxID=2983315 RepID=UPI0021D5EC1E|nr:discoidin domain-containing protein [Actinoplanes sp. KI2]MCU7727938.1 discoidin domain-containing protein [Actinoplanes sp. KI2]
MRVRTWRPRAAAAAVLCVLFGSAYALHEENAEISSADPHASHVMPSAVPVAVTQAAPLPTKGWTATADSYPTTAGRVIDGNAGTIWRTAPTKLPHMIIIDTHNRIALSGLTYLPATDSASGRIGRYEITISDNGTTWSTPIATGTWADDKTLKTVTFGTRITRLVRLRALTEAGNRNTSSSASEISLLGGTDPALARTGWTASADSQETAAENGRAQNVLDGNTRSYWHTQYTGASPALPHRLTIDMKKRYLVSGLAYLPRPATSANGRIGRFTIETSTNGVDWGNPVSSGAFADSAVVQSRTFTPRIARFVRLTALSEAGDRGPWSSAAEITVLGRTDPSLARTGWVATADSQETAAANDRAQNVLDGNASTIWHTRYAGTAPKLPHWVTIDMRKAQGIGGLTYLPRPAGSANGRIGRYQIYTSVDGTTWTARITEGGFPDNSALQTVVFPAVTARYVRVRALSEAGGRGPWSSAAEINILGPSGSVAPGSGSFSAPVGFPLVPVAAAQLPNGKILTWSAFQPDSFTGGYGQTVTATYDPKTGVVTQRTITATGHDMFCPGISTLPDGRILVTGGNDSDKTSIYDPATDAWTAGPAMTTPRGYQASATLSDGRVFTIGGSWSGGHGGQNGTPHKNGEVWSSDGGWTALPGTDVVPMLTGDADPNGDYRKDNHAWLFAWSGGSVLQAGPSRAMNWYGTSGDGSTTPAGTRGDAPDQMNGNAVMYDTGKILALGGSPDYQNSTATTNAYVLTINGVNNGVTTRKVGSMANARSFANSVVLPDGKVAVFGGQGYAVPFSDNASVYAAELWDPATGKFTTMATASVPRNYHSVALLMPDGRVFTGGGGLCGTGCDTNHFDGQTFTPPYLLNANSTAATRPVITSAPSTALNGSKITVKTDSAVTKFAIVRMGTATHTVDTDQRRLSLPPTTITGGYELTIPADAGVALPGYWMLFALNAKGVPSVAKVIKIG